MECQVRSRRVAPVESIRICGYTAVMKKSAQLFKALSDDTRLRIVGLLLDGELCVCEIMGILGLPQSTVSRHLAYLKNSGLVTDRRQGVWMHYRLADGEARLQAKLLELLRRELPSLPEARSDRSALRSFISPRRSAACCKEKPPLSRPADLPGRRGGKAGLSHG